ncbi:MULTISPECIES: SDR family NAD(P)-dependent oxidoreductase [Bacillus]|uniref:Epimerase n=2 Tax=Bacillus TaxID=1386 RepID=A0A0M5JAT3_9BACI|nr:MULTISPECIES: SDR family NAD(P)-dependent oxidoreductase [Bacillus]ALC83489.1 epimerase [Bacillus gobiensis]MBP1082449.1 nucleoside-diphosphate-sugar epimerase [Bacillus capparidis]MED1097303.1 SDR family NAD(P)-dependent oxidoreductase [Bacillus capparidis]
MKKAIVLGATGGVGNPITAELVKRGIETVAFGRSADKLERLANELGNPSLLKLKTGDAFKPEDIVKAAAGADVIFHSANIPYHEMEARLLPLGEAVMKAAELIEAKVVVVDGIYPYGKRTSTQKATEVHPKRPHTRKGKVRLAYEELIFNSRWRGAKPLIVRLPDYYGPSAQASYLNVTMEAIAAGKPTAFIGNMNIPREYVYLPDAARMIVEIASRDASYGQNWHIPGPGVISGHDLVKIAQKASGKRKPVFPLGRISLSLIGMFNPVMKEVVEMLYLTEEPFVLSGEKYEREIGPIAWTPHEQAIEETIRTLMNRNRAADTQPVN